MAFVVLEGFSGTGKTTLARRLEKRGWFRLQESAHALPDHVPVADRGDTYSDYSLLGATLTYSSAISRLRETRNLVSEGYLLSDLAYAKVRFELKKSTAYPALLALCREVLTNPKIRPDLYIILEARHNTLHYRQAGKKERDRNMTGFFRARYYAALAEIHKELGEWSIERVHTDSDSRVTLKVVLALMKKRDVFKQ
jgi:deoxyadenosine/deoxycytidine kinase